MLTNLTCMHTWEKTFLIHAHFAITTVLSNVLSNIFFGKITDNNFQQNNNIWKI